MTTEADPQIPSNQPESENENQPDKPTPAAQQKLSEYVVSWKWLLSGLILLLLVGSLCGGLYYYRYLNLSQDVLGVVQQMKSEADEIRKKVAQLRASNGDPEEIEKLHRESYNLRLEAANLLKGFSDRPGQEANVKVLTDLYDLHENLLEDEWSSPRLVHRRRNMIMDCCKKLIQSIASEDESFPYQLRLMELEWDQGNYAGVIERAKVVLQIDHRKGRENYEAWRYVTLAIMARLQSIPYATALQQLTLPQTMDELLDKVLQMRPENIDIANRYAVFLAEVAGRDEFKQCASSKLLELPQQERLNMAMTAINDMVSRNPDDIRAYLVRYNFKKRYIKPPEDLEKLDADIETILKINPDDPEGLVLAGLATYRQALLARMAGKTQAEKEKKAKAEEYLKRCVEKNPRNDRGYQQLGEFYSAEGRIDDAIQIWNQGVEQRLPMANPELVGRLTMALTGQKRFEEAAKAIDVLTRFIQEIRVSATSEYMRQVQNLASLLTARLYAAESSEAVSKAEAARAAGRAADAQRLFSVAQRKNSDATQILEKLLGNFGAPYDYVVEEGSIYSRLLGDSLILAGRLMADQSKWSKAVLFYEKAMPFEMFRQTASILAAAAYQQLNMPEKAVQLLNDASKRAPNNITLHFLYAQSLFRQQSSRRVPSVADLNLVEQEFRTLAEQAADLPNPWIVDIRLVHIQMLKESLTNDPERILKAQQDAIRKFRLLEDKEFPVKKSEEMKTDESPRTYSDDLAFLSEIAGIYSSLAQISDFDRVLRKMRQLPNGEALYYSELINDALRRNDRDSAVLAVEEALESEILTQAQKQRFVLILQNLKDDSTNSLERIYAQLKTTFDQNPDSLKPQAFFLFANMALDRDDFKQAEVLQARLEQIEGAPEFGTMWRYIKARRMLVQTPPDFDGARKLQEEIVSLDPNWDMAYLLRSSIDEKFVIGKPEDPKIRDRIIESYQQAIRCGNIQAQVWNRLLALYEEAGKADDIKKLRREAMIRNVRLALDGGSQFPQPYQRMYDQAYESIESDPQNTDQIARQCLVLAEGRREKPELIFSLNLAFGKLFLDAGMIDGAMRHLRYVARRGGTYVYPLAVALAKAKQVDEAFTMILDEIDQMPSSMATLVPSILVLLSQVKPSEDIFKRIDKLMDRIEKGERPALRATIPPTTEAENYVDLGVPRRVVSMLVRFPENAETPNVEDLRIFPPEEDEFLEIDEKASPDSSVETGTPAPGQNETPPATGESTEP